MVKKQLFKFEKGQIVGYHDCGLSILKYCKEIESSSSSFIMIIVNHLLKAWPYQIEIDARC